MTFGLFVLRCNRTREQEIPYTGKGEVIMVVECEFSTVSSFRGGGTVSLSEGLDGVQRVFALFFLLPCEPDRLERNFTQDGDYFIGDLIDDQ